MMLDNIEMNIRIPLEKSTSNSMEINVFKRNNFYESVGIISVGLGSIHNRLVEKKGNRLISIPNGTAHFIEHLMFKNSKSKSYLDLFADENAFLNAYTTIHRTNFIFSSTAKFKENLFSLLDLVFLWKADENMFEHEKKIILNEILMYRDQKEIQTRQNILKQIFPGSKLSVDILGDEKDILQMKYSDLLNVYQEAYTPENMSLFVVGNYSADEINEWVDSYFEKKTIINNTEFEPSFYEVDVASNCPTKASFKKEKQDFVYVIKGQNINYGKSSLALLSASLEVFFELLFGNHSEFNRRYILSNEVTNFKYEIDIANEFIFVLFTGESENTEKIIREISETVDKMMKTRKIDIDYFEAVKRNLIGQFLSVADSMSELASMLVDSDARGIDIDVRNNLLTTISINTVLKTIEDFLSETVSFSCDI